MDKLFHTHYDEKSSLEALRKTYARDPLFEAIAIATTLVLVAPTHPASASPEIQSTEAANSTASEITPEVLGQAFEELSASDVPRNINDDSTVTFKLPGMDLTLRDPNASTPYLSGGRENGGFWGEYTSVEQDLIISGGGLYSVPPSVQFPA